jgi:hypothetical protein
MSPSARTIYYFSFYLIAISVTLLFVPNLFLRVLGMPETEEVWIRVVGLLAGLIAFYYYRSAVAGLTLFFRFTVTARILVFVVFFLFVLLKMAKPILIGVGTIDLLAAWWTWSALKKEK